MMRLYDAHNHLQDERFAGRQEELIAACRSEGITAMVVNGACETDWPTVAELARQHPDLVLPAFGYHPWYMAERTPAWRERLLRALDETPGATVGEVGLDRWKAGGDFADQEAVFREQLRLAAARNLPVSVHCLQAWGRLLEILRAEPRPARGFLLHAFGGPVELVPELIRLGAYFSLPGYFAHARKTRQRDTFRHVPSERLLLETDAPDQPLPAERVKYALSGAPSGTGPEARPLNHPANLGAVYAFAAELLNRPIQALAAQVETNFIRLFGQPPGQVLPAPADPSAGPPPAPPPQNQTLR